MTQPTIKRKRDLEELPTSSIKRSDPRKPLERKVSNAFAKFQQSHSDFAPLPFQEPVRIRTPSPPADSHCPITPDSAGSITRELAKTRLMNPDRDVFSSNLSPMDGPSTSRENSFLEALRERRMSMANGPNLFESSSQRENPFGDELRNMRPDHVDP